MGGLKQASLAITIFFSTTKAKAHWKAILPHCLKKCKKTKINDLSIVYYGKYEYIP
jgi:hypothetical protein